MPGPSVRLSQPGAQTCAAARPMSWRGPGLSRRSQKQRQKQRQRTADSVRHLRLLKMQKLATGQPLPVGMPRPSGERAATLLLLQLRKIQQETVRMNAALEYHMKYMRVELATMPGIIITFVEEQTAKVQNWLRLITAFLIVVLLLR